MEKIRFQIKKDIQQFDIKPIGDYLSYKFFYDNGRWRYKYIQICLINRELKILEFHESVKTIFVKTNFNHIKLFVSNINGYLNYKYIILRDIEINYHWYDILQLELKKSKKKIENDSFEINGDIIYLKDIYYSETCLLRKQKIKMILR